jgi:hypothetical protein
MTYKFDNLVFSAGNCITYVAYMENAETKFHPVPLFSLNWDTGNFAIVSITDFKARMKHKSV